MLNFFAICYSFISVLIFCGLQFQMFEILRPVPKFFNILKDNKDEQQKRNEKRGEKV